MVIQPREKKNDVEWGGWVGKGESWRFERRKKGGKERDVRLSLGARKKKNKEKKGKKELSTLYDSQYLDRGKEKKGGQDCSKKESLVELLSYLRRQPKREKGKSAVIPVHHEKRGYRKKRKASCLIRGTEGKKD